MFINYFKIAFRNIIRHKGYSAVNILGLSVGLACVIVISMIIRNELSFDQFHDNKDRKSDNITSMFQKLLNAVDTVPSGS